MEIAFESLNKGPAIFGGNNPLHAVANQIRDTAQSVRDSRVGQALGGARDKLDDWQQRTHDERTIRPTWADAKAQETPASGPNWLERQGQKLQDFGENTAPLTGTVGGALQSWEDKGDVFDQPQIEGQAPIPRDKQRNPVANIGLNALGAGWKGIREGIGHFSQAKRDQFGESGGVKPATGLVGVASKFARHGLNIPDYRQEQWWQNRQQERRRGREERANQVAREEREQRERNAGIE